MNGSLILADCYPEQLMTKDSRIECLTDMLDEVHLLHDDFVRNQESEKLNFTKFTSCYAIILLGIDCSPRVCMNE